MSSWLTQQWCPFDLETTGIDPHEDRIVSWCVGRVGGGQPADTPVNYVNPGIPIPSQATAIHHITDAMVINAPTSRDAVEKIATLLVEAQQQGTPIVGWNVSYDLTLLSAELERYGLPSLTARLGRAVGPVLDGMVLDKHVEPRRRGSRKLSAVAPLYGIELSESEAHGAGADARAAARIVWKIGMKYPEIGRRSLHDLHQEQIHWHQEQKDSLRAYFDGKGITHDGCDGRWPVQLLVLTEQRVAS